MITAMIMGGVLLYAIMGLIFVWLELPDDPIECTTIFILWPFFALITVALLLGKLLQKICGIR